MAYNDPKQVQVIQQALRTLGQESAGAHQIASNALRCLDEIVKRTHIKICGNCNGEGGTIFQHPSGRPEDIFQDCRECEGTGILMA